MNEQHGMRNIRFYYWYVAFSEPLFWGPVLIYSLQNLAHMSLADIFYMEAVVLCVCVVLDIPCGALADAIGRKQAIILGRLFLLGDTICFMQMDSPVGAWAGNLLWAVGFSLQSGADSAFLYDTLRENGRESEYRRIDGATVGIRLALAALCGLATGFLADIHPRLPLYCTLPFMCISLGVAFFFEEPRKTVRYSAHEQLAILWRGMTFAVRSPQIRWMLAFAALLSTTSKLWFFTYNPYFELVALPLSYYGVIFFSLNVVAWFSSHYAHAIEERLGERWSIVLMIVCLALPILVMGLCPLWPCAFLAIVQNIVRGFMRPFVGGYLHRHIDGHIRATVLSTQSSIANLTSIVGLASFGYLTARFTLPQVLVFLGVTMLVLGFAVYCKYVRMNA